MDPSNELVKDAMLISISLIMAKFQETVIKLFFNNTYYFNTMLVTLPKHCLNDCITRASCTTLFKATTGAFWCITLSVFAKS